MVREVVLEVLRRLADEILFDFRHQVGGEDVLTFKVSDRQLHATGDL